MGVREQVRALAALREYCVFRLKQLQEEPDSEKAHGAADAVLCHALKSLGCSDVVEEYERVVGYDT